MTDTASARPRSPFQRSSLILTMALLSCAPAPVTYPDILLFVIDTARADAVSAYGSKLQTTPTLDALAAGGLRYSRAYANAPWTVPSHVTLFTGLLPHAHKAGWPTPGADDSLEMLAERLRALGYQTFGASENPWVGNTFGLGQGFDEFVEADAAVEGLMPRLRTWLAERNPARPSFVFVNVIDPHWPYAVQDQNPFLPEGVTDAEAASVVQWPPDYFCSEGDHARAWSVQYGLYLAEMRAADRKLERVHSAVSASAARALVTMVTSDHGEHFGEASLGNHQFSLRDPLLHIPLIVHGWPDTEPAVIDSPVQLADIVPTILDLLQEPVPSELPGQPLPTHPSQPTASRVLSAEYTDPETPGPGTAVPLVALGRAQLRTLRAKCTPEDRVWGSMQAVISYPHKLIRFERFAPELYDLDDDPREERNLALERPEEVRRLGLAVATPGQSALDDLGQMDAADSLDGVPSPVLDQLRSLGYIGE